jgi:hypothetical protein
MASMGDNCVAKIGFIGSPKNWQDANFKKQVGDLLNSLIVSGAQIYVGFPNEQLMREALVDSSSEEDTRKHVFEKDMANVDGNLDAILVLPGGPGAEAEAKKAKGSNNLYTFGLFPGGNTPNWFDELDAKAHFSITNWLPRDCARILMEDIEANRPDAICAASNKPGAAEVDRDEHQEGTTSVNIGYIGSPANLENLYVKTRVGRLITALISSGAQIHVGSPNFELMRKALALVDSLTEEQICKNVLVTDMANTEGNFDAIIVLPGGPMAEDEANKWNKITKLFTFTDTGSNRGSPKWFEELFADGRFTITKLKHVECAGVVMKAIDEERANAVCSGENKPKGADEDNCASEGAIKVEPPVKKQRKV